MRPDQHKIRILGLAVVFLYVALACWSLSGGHTAFWSLIPAAILLTALLGHGNAQKMSSSVFHVVVVVQFVIACLSIVVAIIINAKPFLLVGIASLLPSGLGTYLALGLVGYKRNLQGRD
jgi:hypothetical protein